LPNISSGISDELGGESQGEIRAGGLLLPSIRAYKTLTYEVATEVYQKWCEKLNIQDFEIGFLMMWWSSETMCSRGHD